jgi:hypothetical protein
VLSDFIKLLLYDLLLLSVPPPGNTFAGFKNVVIRACLSSSLLLHVMLLSLTSLPPSSADGCMQTGMTVVHYAARSGHEVVLRVLHELDLDFTVTDEVSEYLYT